MTQALQVFWNSGGKSDQRLGERGRAKEILGRVEAREGHLVCISDGSPCQPCRGWMGGRGLIRSEEDGSDQARKELGLGCVPG